jgi:hypothetical protein
MADPIFQPVERWLNRDEFSIRREIIPNTTARGSPVSQPKFLPSVFEDAHSWPLQWGGPEVEKARFYAHKQFNAGAQKRMENAGRRLAEMARKEGARVRATVAVTKYKERNLLERVTYKFEGVTKANVIEPLGEITIVQDLSQEQRTAIVEGQLVPQRGGSDVLEYSFKGRTVKIDPTKMIKISPDDVFASLDSRLADFIHGLKKGPLAHGPKAPAGGQGGETKPASPTRQEQAASRQLGGARTAEAPRLTGNKATDTRMLGGGRPAPAQRAATRPIPPSPTPRAPDPATIVSSTPPRQASPAEVRALEKDLASGETEVVNIGNKTARVTVKEIGAIFKTGVKAAARTLLPSIIGLLEQKIIESKVASGVERGINQLYTQYPQVRQILDEKASVRAAYQKAKSNLDTNGKVWQAQIERATTYGSKTWDEAHNAIIDNVSAIGWYYQTVMDRNHKLNVMINELGRLGNEIDAYSSGLVRIANEMEGKVLLTLRVIGGYPFALELFGWAQFMRQMADNVGSYQAVRSEIERGYTDAFEAGTKLEIELSDLIDRWNTVLANAEQAAGI